MDDAAIGGDVAVRGDTIAGTAVDGISLVAIELLSKDWNSVEAH